MLQNTVMSKLHFQQCVILAVASSDIAASLFKGERTTYSRFEIPLNAEAN